jgi:hypothetical protein
VRSRSDTRRAALEKAWAIAPDDAVRRLCLLDADPDMPSARAEAHLRAARFRLAQMHALQDAIALLAAGELGQLLPLFYTSRGVGFSRSPFRDRRGAPVGGQPGGRSDFPDPIRGTANGAFSLLPTSISHAR